MRLKLTCRVGGAQDTLCLFAYKRKKVEEIKYRARPLSAQKLKVVSYDLFMSFRERKRAHRR